MQTGAVQRHYTDHVTSIMPTPIVLPPLLEIIHVPWCRRQDARDAAVDGLMTSGASRRCECDFRDDEASTAAAAADADAAWCRRCCAERRQPGSIIAIEM